MTDRKYKFSWDLLGDIAKGRPNLGPNTRLEVYRLMQFAFRDVMEQHLGTEKPIKSFMRRESLRVLNFTKISFQSLKNSTTS